MPRFTTVNPFNTEYDDPNTVYYNGQLMCKDNSAPLAKFIDAQDVPIIKDVGKYSVLLTQLEINNVTKDLPVYTPVLGEQISKRCFFLVSSIMMGAYYNDDDNEWIVTRHQLNTDANVNVSYYSNDPIPVIKTQNNINIDPIPPPFADFIASQSLEEVKMPVIRYIDGLLAVTEVIGTANITYIIGGVPATATFNILYFNQSGAKFVICIDTTLLGLPIIFNTFTLNNINITFKEPFTHYGFTNVLQFFPYRIRQYSTSYMGIQGEFVEAYPITEYSFSPAISQSIYSNTMVVLTPTTLQIDTVAGDTFGPIFTAGNKITITPKILAPDDLTPMIYSVSGASANSLAFIPLTIASVVSSTQIIVTIPSSEVGVIQSIPEARVSVFAGGVSPVMTFLKQNSYAPGDYVAISSVTGGGSIYIKNLNKIQNMVVSSATSSQFTISGCCGVGAVSPVAVIDSITPSTPSVSELNTVSLTTTNASSLKFTFLGALNYYYNNIQTFYSVNVGNDFFIPIYIRAKPFLVIADLINSIQGAYNEHFRRWNGSFFQLFNYLQSPTLEGINAFPFIQTNTPSITYNPSSALFEFNFDPYGFINVSTNTDRTCYTNPLNASNTVCSSLDLIVFLANKEFADFFAGFSWTIYDAIQGFSETIYVYNILTTVIIPTISPTTGQQIQLTSAPSPSPYFINPKNPLTITSKYQRQQDYRVTQEYSFFGSGFSPVDAIVLTTTNIPVQKEYNTKVLQSNETNNLGNNTNKGTFLNILYTLNFPVKNPNDWKTVINLSQIPEHKKNYMMSLNTELKVIDVQFWWKNRLTNELIPLTMPNNSSILFKLRFRKED